MNPNRFRRGTDYSKQVTRRPAPVLDEYGELRQPAAPIAPREQPTPTPTPVATVQIPVVADTPTVEAPKPIYEQPVAKPAPESLIDLSKPDTGGWLDEISPRPLTPETSTVSEGAGEAVAELPTTVSINISLPTKITLPKPHLPAWNYRKIAIRAGIGVGAAVLVTVGIIVAMHMLKKPPQAALTQSQKLAASLTRPSFTPVAPKDKAGLAASQAGSTTFDGTRNTYSYQDSLKGTPIVVSQQPVPAKFNSATEAVSSVAKSLNAKVSFATKKGTAYVATNDKSSTQIVVMTTNDLLIFLETNFAHDNADWTDYINSLK